MDSFDSATTTILLIDGHEKDRTYYVDRLKNFLPGWVILEAKDGRSGIDLYKSRHIDCIVTEIQLPDMAGFQLLFQVVPLMSPQNVAVIFLARAALPASVDFAGRHGAQAFLMKRLTSGEELVEAVRKAIAVVGQTCKERREQDLQDGLNTGLKAGL
jgi:DNA-binding NarL/FixJ family response regulator